MSERELQKDLNQLQIGGLSENAPGNENKDSGQNQKILTELTMKITQRFKEEMNIKSIKPQQTQQQIKLEQTISKEVESNTCPICFELMVPPNYSPILLFPCGHTFCKNCCFEKNGKVRKIDKCPICRCKIQSHALNISL